MKFIKVLIVALILGVAVFTSTSCDDTEVAYIDIVNVDIMSPDASMRMPGDSVHFHVNFTNTDGGKVHNVLVEMYNVTKDSMVYSFEEHAHVDGSYEHHDDIVVTEMHSDMRVVAKTWEHDSAHAVSDTVDFHVHM